MAHKASQALQRRDTPVYNLGKKEREIRYLIESPHIFPWNLNGLVLSHFIDKKQNLGFSNRELVF